MNTHKNSDGERPRGEIVIYQTGDGRTRLGVRFEGDTAWLTQAQLVELFQTSKANVSEHIKNIFTEGELDEAAVVRKFRTTASDGKSYQVSHYNLDMIISLGYRVHSKIATQFRRWATERLKEYIVKGFAMDDARLKELGDGNYWRELLDRIRDIRSSEKVLYRQVLDLYATSIDYDPHSGESVAFFKMVQNKLHYAAHGHTAAEVIWERADAQSPFMGLRTFSGDFPALQKRRGKNTGNSRSKRCRLSSKPIWKPSGSFPKLFLNGWWNQAVMDCAMFELGIGIFRGPCTVDGETWAI